MTTTLTRPAPARTPSPALRLRPPVLRRWWTDAVGLVIWATTLVVVALWVHNGNVADLVGGWGPASISLGRLTGLISSNLLLFQVLGMARVPFIESSMGQDRINKWHRWLGFTSLNLLLVHAILTTIGYAVLDRIPFLSELWSLVTTAPGMLLATVGTVLLVMVAVTSMRVARRKLRYESWHLLHLYAYLGAGFALPHQLWTGADFMGNAWATAYWWGLYGLVLLAVVVYRVIVPMLVTSRQKLRVTRVVTESPGVVSVYVGGSRLAELEVAAGQFFVWRFRTGKGWSRGHPLSLSGAPTTQALRVTVGVRGDDGERIARMRPGTEVLVEGPYGRLRPEVRTMPNMVLVGSGLGIAPLIALAQEAVLAGRTTERPTVLVRRMRDGDRQPLQADIDHLVSIGALRVVDLPGSRSTTGTPWLPQHLGHIPGPQALRQVAPDLLTSDVFVCGAGPWCDAVAEDLRAAGVTRAALHVESFTL